MTPLHNIWVVGNEDSSVSHEGSNSSKQNKKKKSGDADVSANEPGRSKSSRMKDGLARAASYTS